MGQNYASKKWFALSVLLIAQFMVSIDMTVVNIALPAITTAINPAPDEQLWIVDAYSLVLAGLLFATGSLSDRVGRKKTLIAGLIIFGTASLGICAAQSASFVITIRAIMGAGGAMIMPVTVSMIRTIFDDEQERTQAIAYWSVVCSIGMAAGPIIGGILLEAFSWHSAFLLNVPLAFAAAFGASFSYLKHNIHRLRH